VEVSEMPGDKKHYFIGLTPLRLRKNRATFVLRAFLILVLTSCGGARRVVAPRKLSDGETVAGENGDGLASEFVIGAFPGPPNGEINSARYEEIARAGIDVIVPFWGTMDGVRNPEMLDLAHGAGLRVLAMDTRIGPPTLSPDAAFDPSVIEAIANDYKEHPALFAYGVRDEPSADLIPRIAEICRLFRKSDPAHEPLINLFPGYATSEQLGRENFRDYVREWIEKTNVSVIMYDHYPLKQKRTIDTGWHRDLALFREESGRAGIPFWIFIQCEGIRGILRVPTRAEIFWQATTALAYGARGVWWYRYWGQPSEEGASEAVEQHPGSMIDSHGNRSPSYGHVREANRFLRRAGSALLGWENRAVARFKNGRRVGSGECPAVLPVGEDFNLVVGTFIQGEARRVVLANDSYEHSATFRLSDISAPQTRNIIVSLAAEPPDDQSNPAATWTLGPGGCVLIELVSCLRNKL